MCSWCPFIQNSNHQFCQVPLDIKADEKQSAKEKPAKKEEVAKKAGGKDKNGDAAAGDKDDREEMKRKDGGEEQEKRQEQLLEALEAQRREQEKLLQEQKALLQELKDHKDQEHQVVCKHVCGFVLVCTITQLLFLCRLHSLCLSLSLLFLKTRSDPT